ncbi:TcmI family type II polyketide cyclase [Streptomyces sp. NPDC035033]|uniref:TcmI family type II polyketide cyclase n=1 Tax=Streptomyces sp. NPDC035033 TaxID=3155368 RepID=UPI0033EA2C45
MHSTLIVARMEEGSAGRVAQLFSDFDATDMPERMGTLRRQLFTYHGLYFHLQDFARPDGGERIERHRHDPRFTSISAELKPYVSAFDPSTWTSPSDAMARCFYRWEAAS